MNENLMDESIKTNSGEEGIWCVRNLHPIDKKISKDKMMDAEVHIPVQEDCGHDKTRGEKCSSCCKKFTTFLFSTVGLCCLVVGYSILGGFIFMKLEAPHEKRLKDDVMSRRKIHVERLWNITEEYNVLFKENWTDKAETILKKFAEEVVEATKRNGWDGKEGEAELQWSFAGALLYSVTLLRLSRDLNFCT